MSAACGGFTLIEILSALLVVAIGIIGVAAIYGDTARITEKNAPRRVAAELAEAIAARIRANTAGRIGYASVVGVVCNANAQVRQADEAAEQEAACWHDEVERRLPSGMGTITRDPSTNPPSYLVAVSWSSPQSGAASYVIRVAEE